jgi:hypothetical protein
MREQLTELTAAPAAAKADDVLPAASATPESSVVAATC